MFIRPYQCAPTIKDEIEAWVKEMLQSGIIQTSTGPFSSPVLMVRQKDQTWRLCWLSPPQRSHNQMEIPSPNHCWVFGRAARASWFSSLDLRARFHQILFKEGEEFKIAFQTHSGHYEFRVMAFGLICAPATFPSAMNNTLLPVLHKFAPVFFNDILVYNP